MSKYDEDVDGPEAQRVIETAKIVQKLSEDGVPKIGADPRPFAQLLSSDRELAAVLLCVEEVIWRSFGEDIRRDPFGYKKPTPAEVKRRFGLCETWFRKARGDLGYSLERTLDMMGHALRAALDGQDFDPSAAESSRIWTPT